MTVKLKMTLWYTVLMLVIVASVLGFMLSIVSTVTQEQARNQLEMLVDNNFDKIIFRNDRLEIMHGFDYYKNGVYLLIYSNDNQLLGGQLPSYFDTEPTFNENGIQTVTSGGIKYFICDRRIHIKGGVDFWLHGIIPAESTVSVVDSILRLALFSLPVLVLFASLGGWAITKRAFRPIEDLSAAANKISVGDDLSKRIAIKRGKDEIHRLAETFDGMFERLERSFLMERQFTSDASHELRTPISVILAECDFASHEAEHEADYKEALEVINRQAIKMSRVIAQLLSYTRLEQGTEKIELEDIDLSELASVVCEEQTLLSHNGITLTSSIERGISVKGDFSMITSLMQNLISNAYKYGKQNGNITVILKETGGKAFFFFFFDGIGMKESELPLIWRRFYQVNKARSNEDGSLGLGLAMAKQIAELHKGDVSVSSELGVGSTFTLSIPLKEK